jgi:chromate reductase
MSPDTGRRQVLALVGSLRDESWNHRLARVVAGLSPPGLNVELARADLPLYDADADVDHGRPQAVADLRSRVEAADGLVVVTPEYNYGLPGVLKNTLDWLSRPAYASPLRDLPVTALGATPGPGNTGRALAQLTQVLAGVAAAQLPWPAFAVGSVGDLLDGEGALVHEPSARRLRAQMEAFERWIAAVEVFRAA